MGKRVLRWLSYDLRKHEVGGGEVDNVNFVPIPIFELESRYRRTQLRLENRPSVSFTYGNDNSQATRLGVLDTSIRQYVGQSWFVGLRYLNYSAHYVTGNRFYANGRLADRNVGLLPLIGYRLRW